MRFAPNLVLFFFVHLCLCYVRIRGKEKKDRYWIRVYENQVFHCVFLCLGEMALDTAVYPQDLFSYYGYKDCYGRGGGGGGGGAWAYDSALQEDDKA